MDLESASRELYGELPSRFTAARDATASEARHAGQPELAASLKKLRRPSVGAWLANVLVREQPRDVERLIALGVELRAPKRTLEGEQIRKVSREKSDAISKLVRDARSKASALGQSVSAAALEELDATLEAAFADPQAAETLRGGRLSSGLSYSGLGLNVQARTPPRGASTSKSETDQIAAQRGLEKANREVEQADTELEKAKRAVAAAAAELVRLKSAEALAVQRSKEARHLASAAKKKVQMRH